MRRNLLPGLLLLFLAGCAAGGAPPSSASAERDAALAEMMEIARRLPPRVGSWVRTREAEGDAVVGVSMGYRLPGISATVTAFVYHPALMQPGGTRSPIAPGPDGPEARRDQLQFGPGPVMELSQRGGPVVQRCGILLQRQASPPTAGYVCAAGVDGYLLKFRGTVQIGNDAPAEWAAVHQLVGILVTELTVAAARNTPSGQRS